MSGETKTPDRNPTGHTSTCTETADSGVFSSSPSQIPIQTKANRSHNSNPTAPSTDACCGRHPSASPAPVITTSPATALVKSARQRPVNTASPLTGIARIRSVTPFAASEVTARTVDSSPNNMVIASMPGMRKSMYAPSRIAIAPPKSWPNITTIRTGNSSVTAIETGRCFQCTRIRRVRTAVCTSQDTFLGAAAGMVIEPPPPPRSRAR